MLPADQALRHPRRRLHAPAGLHDVRVLLSRRSPLPHPRRARHAVRRCVLSMAHVCAAVAARVGACVLAWAEGERALAQKCIDRPLAPSLSQRLSGDCACAWLGAVRCNAACAQAPPATAAILRPGRSAARSPTSASRPRPRARRPLTPGRFAPLTSTAAPTPLSASSPRTSRVPPTRTSALVRSRGGAGGFFGVVVSGDEVAVPYFHCQRQNAHPSRIAIAPAACALLSPSI